MFGDPVAGWPSLVCIITFIGGIQLFCMGIMGQYIAKTYMEVKRRPHYIVKDSNIEEFDAKNKVLYNDTKGLMPENKKVPVSEGLLLMEKRKTDHGYHSISRWAQHRAGCVI